MLHSCFVTEILHKAHFLLFLSTSVWLVSYSLPALSLAGSLIYWFCAPAVSRGITSVRQQSHDIQNIALQAANWPPLLSLSVGPQPLRALGPNFAPPGQKESCGHNMISGVPCLSHIKALPPTQGLSTRLYGRWTPAGRRKWGRPKDELARDLRLRVNISWSNVRTLAGCMQIYNKKHVLFIIFYYFSLLCILKSLSGNSSRVTWVRLQQPQEQRYPVLQGHAGSFRVFIIQRTLTWTTGSLTCVGMRGVGHTDTLFFLP